jgi:hypothetical protein
MTMILAKTIGFCFLLTIGAANLSAQSSPTLAFGDNRDLSYPEILFQQKDDYRAITEALRLKFESSDEVKLAALDRLLYKSYFRLGDFDRADAIADDLLENDRLPEADPTHREIAACQVWSLTERERPAAARQLWERYLKDETTDPYPSADSTPGFINPDKAERYAMILPGAGFLLSRQYEKAVVSFLLNALFIAGSYHYFNHQQYATAGLLFFFEIGWYRGGINASSEAAVAANQQNIRQYRRQWYKTNLNCAL